MSDDDSDPEARGVDALCLLKQGSIVPRSASETSAGPSSAQPISVPLVQLLPSQKRARSHSQDLYEQTQPSTSQRVQTGNPASNKQVPQTRSSQEGDIKQHSSAPERCLSLAAELRNSKSAPDLTLPALAAIRGLQNGTLQVDRHTRMKIAAAAKRVLEARELKRRSSQEREPHTSYPYPQPDPVSPLALKSQTMWDPHRQGVLSASPSPPERRRSEGKGGSLEGDTLQGAVPGSSTTAAARGQSPSGAAQGNFHRPTLNTSSQSGALLTTTHRPFTVTTGLPRFSKAAQSQGEEEQAVPIMPTTPLGKHGGDVSVPTAVDSKVLAAEDIFKSQPDRDQ